jgi:hypothetical protein
MINSEIISFINKAAGQKISREQIRNALTANGGWTAEDVEEAFLAIDALQNEPPEIASVSEVAIPNFRNIAAVSGFSKIDGSESTVWHETKNVGFNENDSFYARRSYSSDRYKPIMMRWVLKTGLVKDENAAYGVLMALVLLLFAMTFIIWPRSAPTPSANQIIEVAGPGGLPQKI